MRPVAATALALPLRPAMAGAQSSNNPDNGSDGVCTRVESWRPDDGPSPGRTRQERWREERPPRRPRRDRDDDEDD